VRRDDDASEKSLQPDGMRNAARQGNRERAKTCDSTQTGRRVKDRSEAVESKASDAR
jgi:hypothetical protein